MPADRAFLASSLFGVLNTANALRPCCHPPAAALAGFVAGLPTSELPLHTLAAQLAATAAYARKGALRTPVGRAGLVLSGVSIAGLMAVHRRASEAHGFTSMPSRMPWAASTSGWRARRRLSPTCPSPFAN